MNITTVMPGMSIALPDPNDKSLGGSETAALQLGRTFARQGHQATLYCNVERPARWEGVKLVPISVYLSDESARTDDLLIIQRDPTLLTLPHGARKTFFWVHDQLVPEMVPTLRSVLPAIDRILCVSQWQADQALDLVPGLRSEKLLVSRNGIDLELPNAAVRGIQRDSHSALYTARPERGLEMLLEHVFPRILAAEPRATLHLAAYDDANPTAESYYRHLSELAEKFGDRVVQHGALAKRDLYRLMAGSGVYLYPTPAPINPSFAETSCITAMEAMACGLPWVSTDAGALPETVGDAGVIVPLNGAAHAGDGDVPDRLAAEALRIMRDPEHAGRLRAAGKTRARSFGWPPVADQILAAAAEKARPRAARLGGTAPCVAICTPTRGTPNLDYVDSLMQTRSLLTELGIESIFIALAGCNLVPQSRNLIAATALSSPRVTHLMWIDDDIAWAPEDVTKLLEFDVDLVCGLYPKKEVNQGNLPAHYVFRPLNTGSPIPPSDPATWLLEVDAAGAGFMLTKRVVYERMMKAYPQEKITAPDNPSDPSQLAILPWMSNYFPVYVENGAMVPESYSFCRRWRAIGGKVLVDTEIKLTHHGFHAFKGNPARMFRTVSRGSVM